MAKADGFILKDDRAWEDVRRIHTQEVLEYDRRTGIETGQNAGRSRVDSVAPLPPEIHALFLAMDHKYGQISADLKHGHHLEDDPERLKLTPAETRALLFIGRHYSENPI